METKVCTKCKEEKSLEEFYKTKNNKSGRESSCKVCRKQDQMNRKKGIYKKPYKVKDEREAKPGHKFCTKCKIEKPTSEFNKDIVKRDGLSCKCKVCNRAENKARYKKNSEKMKRAAAEYREKNREKHNACSRKYYHEHKEELAVKDKIYRENHKEEKREYNIKYLEENRERVNAIRRERYKGPCYVEEYVDRLVVTDKPKFENGVLTVICKKCGKRFAPKFTSVKARVDALRNKPGQETNFYCSDKCKGSCKLFKFMPGVQVDPDSKLYIPKSETEEARACQTNHLKQLQIDEVGYLYCERCGEESEIVHLHHTQEIAKHGREAISSAGHILLCPDCHKELHRTC